MTSYIKGWRPEMPPVISGSAISVCLYANVFGVITRANAELEARDKRIAELEDQVLELQRRPARKCACQLVRDFYEAKEEGES